jgi:hypothetical protein
MIICKPPEAGSTPRCTALIAAPHILQAFYGIHCAVFVLIIVDGSTGKTGTSAMFLLGPLCLSFARFLPNKQNRSSREPQNARCGPRNTVSSYMFLWQLQYSDRVLRFASIWMQLIVGTIFIFFTFLFLLCIFTWNLIQKNPPAPFNQCWAQIRYSLPVTVTSYKLLTQSY